MKTRLAVEGTSRPRRSQYKQQKPLSFRKKVDKELKREKKKENPFRKVKKKKKFYLRIGEGRKLKLGSKRRKGREGREKSKSDDGLPRSQCVGDDATKQRIKQLLAMILNHLNSGSRRRSEHDYRSDE